MLGPISMSTAVTLFLIAAVIFAGELNAQQQSSSAVATRQGQIEAEQTQKAATLTSDTPPHEERLFLKTMKRISDVLQLGPVHVQVGGLSGGAGLSAGPALEWKSRSQQYNAVTSSTSARLPDEFARGSAEFYFSAVIYSPDHEQKYVTVTLRKTTNGYDVAGVERAW